MTHYWNQVPPFFYDTGKPNVENNFVFQNAS